MATGSRRRRRSRVDKQPKRQRQEWRKKGPPAAAVPTTVDDVPDHLLELILLQLDSSACILRAAASCRRWRRIVVAAGFLSHYRSLHAHNAPFVAGHYHAFDPDWVDYDSPPITGNPAFVPSPSLTVGARHFSLDFLPDSDSGWALADSRGSLLLVFRRRTGWAAIAQSRSFPDLLVCEPLTRRCQGVLRPEHATCLGVFLLDGDHVDGSEGGSIGMSNFRVVSVLHEYHVSEEGRGMPVACVFTSGSDGGGWRVLPGASSTSSAIVSLPGAVDRISFAGRANGSLYWVIAEDDDGRAMLVFDEATMEFSRVPYLTDDNTGGPYDRWSFRVIAGEDGALRVVRLVSNELMVLVQRQQQNQGSHEWVVEKLVRLSEATLGLEGRKERFFQRNAMILAAHEAYVLVTPHEQTWLFSVELETLRVEREHERNKYAGAAYPAQLPCPPSLMACAEHGRRRRSSCY